jgi:hypothetical protein
MPIIGYLYEDYHDARSLEHKDVFNSTFLCQVLITQSSVK